MTRPKRIGLLGGTFDPIHIAHLHIAQSALHHLALDEVRFAPAGSPPHKPGRPVTPGPDRLAMLELAIAGTPGLVVDPIDLGEHAPSYTSDLLARVQEEHPGDDLWFVIGGDSLAEFHTWHEPERILAFARLAVAERPGWSISDTIAAGSRIHLEGRVDTFDSVPIDLSATRIRKRIAAGEPVDWLVPASVLSYVRERNLYTSGPGQL